MSCASPVVPVDFGAYSVRTVAHPQVGYAERVVVTDWGGCHDTREAALYGLDLEMGSYTNGLTSESAFTYDDYYLANPYKEMLQKGEVPMSTLLLSIKSLWQAC